MPKRIAILGAGESGTGSAVLAKKQGYDVFVSDNAQIKQKYKEILFDYEITWEENKHTERLILNADEIIKSPGIPERTPIVQAARKKKYTCHLRAGICCKIHTGKKNMHHGQQRENNNHFTHPPYDEKGRIECGHSGEYREKLCHAGCRR